MPDIDGATGYAVQGVELEVIDAGGKAVARGVTGHTKVRTSGMGDAYLGDPGASARAFRAGWFHTDDTGYLTRDGALVVTGRVDDLINVGGSKFAAAEIEQVLNRIAGVLDSAAFGVPDAMGRQTICAAVVTNGEVDLRGIERAFSRRARHPAAARPAARRSPAAQRPREGRPPSPRRSGRGDHSGARSFGRPVDEIRAAPAMRAGYFVTSPIDFTSCEPSADSSV